VLEKEIERVGVPAVLITTLLPTAKLVGANRVVQGIAVTSPVGNPRVSNKEEKAIRKKMLESAFELLASEMPDQHDTGN
jgi:glycine reductase